MYFYRDGWYCLNVLNMCGEIDSMNKKLLLSQEPIGKGSGDVEILHICIDWTNES